MRAINTTNFEQGNVEYIQFWVLDPYVGKGNISPSNSGKLYFNLGEISEDVLKRRKETIRKWFGARSNFGKSEDLFGETFLLHNL